MGYPAQTDLMKLFADYYNTVEDGVLNNRWMQIDEAGRQAYIDEIYRSKAEGKGIPFQIEIGDYYTPEYARVLNYDTEKWELCRGVGMSFGYNRNENPANFMKAKDIIWCIIDVTAKNPERADGAASCDRCLAEGQWRSHLCHHLPGG